MPIDYESIPSSLFSEDTDVDNAYILYDHMGGLICVYGNAEGAVDRAVEELTKDYQYDDVHIDVFDWAIMVRSSIGEITILIEKIY